MKDSKLDFYRWFEDELMSRWPRWQINASDLSDWHRAFDGTPGDILAEAVSKHKTEDDPVKPSVKLIKK